MLRVPLLLLVVTATLLADGRTLFRSPTVNKTHIVFAYADDLWIVPRAGGEASRLSNGPGMETDPIFSPDGSQVAFTAEYDGSVDVFVVPSSGGVPKRLTFHPGVDRASGWTPDGKEVLFTNSGSTYSNMPRLYTVGLNGGLPKEVPLPIAADGALSPDAKSIAYLPWARADQSWKRYRGGRATAIWLASLADSSVVKVPRTDSNDHTPMWVGNTIYFLSDRSGPYTLFAYDVPSKKLTQLLEAKGLDIKDANASSDAIAYEQFGEIFLYDLKAKKANKVNINLNADLLSVRPRMEKVSQYLRNASLSPTGVRVAVEARGEIFTIPAEKGDIRNLTNSQGVADRDPAWSPDGKWIAYFSDESGEYQLHLRDQTGRGEVTKIALEAKPTFYYDLNWSPDAKNLAYVDKKGQLWYVDIAKKQPVLVDKANYEGARTEVQPRWAPDSRWIAFNKQLKSGYSAVMIYSLAEAKSTQLTDGLSDARDAAWDKNGKYLYFTASTDSGPGLLGLDMASNNRPITRSIYLTVLQRSEPSPLAPESDEEKAVEAKAVEEKKPDAKPEAKPDAKPEAKKLEVKIDFEQIDQRMLPLPIPARNYERLTAGKTGTLFFLEFPVVQAAATGPGSTTLHKFELNKRKSDVFMAGANGFDLSANGEKILIAAGQGRWMLAGTAAPPRPGEGALKTDQLETLIDPVAEWKQMYKEVWRLERDFFYDPGYHGLDIQSASERYELYLRNVGSRNDLNYLFSEMLGELSIGHLFVRGGDQLNEPKTVNGGLLGADYKLENGRYRFAKVLEGDNWSPQTRAPLTQPGVNVKAGEYLLAVNGREVKDSDNIFEVLEGKGGKSVLLKVGPNANGEGSREVTVVPMPNEGALRTLTWVEENRKKVDQASGGKLAYMHLPDTAFGGYRNFNRYYFAQADRQGAVLDERFNSGGQAADYIIDHLRRPIWNYWAARDGDTYTTPGMLIRGPKVMLANEYSGSGGDLLPWLFKRAKLGPVIGKRTWGGLVGIGGYPPLVDGGSVTAPHFAFFSPEGKWEVENHGTDVDIEVDLDPKAWREGRDSQLDKAIEVALAELKKNPIVQPQRPAYPNYQKK
jgi:tricorn protease